MSKQLIIIGILLTLGAWFLLGEKRSVFEKISLIIVIIFVYVAYRLMSGSTLQQILQPLTGSN